MANVFAEFAVLSGARRRFALLGAAGAALLLSSCVRYLSDAPPALALDARVGAQAAEAALPDLAADFMAPDLAADAGMSRQWQAPVRVEHNDLNSASTPRVVVGSDGAVHAIWLQSDGSTVKVWGNRRQPGGDWLTPRVLGGMAAGEDDRRPELAADGLGGVFAVWSASTNVYSSRFDPAAESWTHARAIGNGLGYTKRSRVDTDLAGNAISVWYQFESSADGVRAARFDKASDVWEPAVLLDSNDDDSEEPVIAVDPNGDALALWREQRPGGLALVSSRFDAQTRLWAPSKTIASAVGLAFPEVAGKTLADLLAVWWKNDGTRLSVEAGVYRAGSDTWYIGTPTVGGTTDRSSPQLAADSSGNAIAVWHEQAGDTIWASRFAKAPGQWGTPIRIDAHTQGNASGPRVAVSAGGDAIAVWSHSDSGVAAVYSASFRLVAGSWSTPVRVTGGSAGDATQARVAMGADGSGVIIWRQADGARDDIWAIHSP